MICSKCGNQVPDGTAFCTMCGNRLKDAVPMRPAGGYDAGNSYEQYGGNAYQQNAAPDPVYMGHAMDADGNYYQQNSPAASGTGFLKTNGHLLLWAVCALLAVGIVFQAYDIAKTGSAVRSMEQTYISADSTSD